MNLQGLGWDDVLAREWEAWQTQPHLQPGRVLIGFNYLYRVGIDGDEIEAVLAGRLKHRATSRGDLPAVGDWVVVRRRPDEERGTMIGILPRRSRFSRRAAGHVTDEQVVAANVDVGFIVMGLDDDFSLRRLERYLLLAHESGAAPVVLLTKPDLAPAGEAAREDRPAAAAACAGGVPVHVVNPRANEGIGQVAAYLTPGRTGALLGSSGVGKSTIINRLVGTDVRKTRETRTSDAKGRHTTTHRELVILPDGGLIIDTPGMRELQLWDAADAVRDTFDDVVALAGGCHFADCRHRDEPRCAVKAAVAEGRLPAPRLESYLTLRAELAHLARQQDERAQIQSRRQGRSSGRAQSKALRANLRAKRGR
jgi:ribosome biogenesis GTPase / thiamine phosphate phosphatase